MLEKINAEERKAGRTAPETNSPKRKMNERRRERIMAVARENVV